VSSIHFASLHGGPSLRAYFVLQHAWILGRRQLVKSIVKNCVRCQKTKPLLAHQLMGDLPASRVIPDRPFIASGLDYAAPFQVRTTKSRGHRSYKTYVALFVCFVTRALHLELVSDLMTSAFISAFRRFTSRHGLCRNLYSNNSTTFKGADNEIMPNYETCLKLRLSSTIRYEPSWLITESLGRLYHQTHFIMAVYGKPGLSP
jgi:hypothetical protein